MGYPTTSVSYLYELYFEHTDKVYVGQSVRPLDRFKSHRTLLRRGTHHCAHLQHGYSKGTWGRMGMRIISVHPVSSVDDAETAAIASLGPRRLNSLSSPRGKNMDKVPGDTRRRVSEKIKALWQEGRYASLFAPKDLTDEQRKDIAESVKSAWKQGAYAGRDPRSWMTGRVVPAESVALSAKNRTGLARSEESRARMSEAQKKRAYLPLGRRGPLSAEAKARRVRAFHLIHYVLDPDGVEHVVVGAKGLADLMDSRRRVCYLLAKGTHAGFVLIASEM